MDRVADVIVEGGFNQNWIKRIFHKRAIKTIHRRKKNDVPKTSKIIKDIRLLYSPILVLLVGIWASVLCWLAQRLYYRRVKTTDKFSDFTRKSYRKAAAKIISVKHCTDV